MLSVSITSTDGCRSAAGRVVCSWSVLRAPMIAEVTPGRLMTQARATWAGVASISFAIFRTASTAAQVRSEFS